MVAMALILVGVSQLGAGGQGVREVVLEHRLAILVACVAAVILDMTYGMPVLDVWVLQARSADVVGQPRKYNLLVWNNKWVKIKPYRGQNLGKILSSIVDNIVRQRDRERERKSQRQRAKERQRERQTRKLIY